MIKKILIGIFVAVMVLGIVAIVIQSRDCAARGGVLVKGALQYVCVPAVQVKP